MTVPRPEPGQPLAKNAEQQMRNWVLGLEVRERLADDRAVRQLSQEIHPYVTLSREAGAGAAEVARRVGDKLGWPTLDKDLLDYMADQYKLPKHMLKFVDETTSNWVYDVFGTWLDEHLVSHQEYVSHLGRIVLLAARHVSSVFVGRGIQFLLPRDLGLTIRIVAPLNQRIDRIMQVRKLEHDEAKKYVAKIDLGRRDFVYRYFHHDVDDSSLYDLVINMKYLDVDEAADLIVNQCRRRFRL